MKIRKAAVAGRFYEADPDKLRKEVDSYMGARGKADGAVLGVFAPHAGYAYSGAVAGTAFSFLRGMDFDTAVIIGTAHTEAVRGAAMLTAGAFETPLGLAEIDTELAGELLSDSGLFEERPSAHSREHSIEVELPFLQALGRPFRFVPVLVNTEDIGTLQELGRVIGRKIKGRKAVVCVSSDLSHYPPGGLAERSDLSLLASFQTAVRNGNLEHFALANSLLLEAARGAMDTAACGFAAMAVGAAACMEAGADDFRLLRYTHSGNISGDNGGVVGYGAGLFTARGKRAPRALGKKAKAELLSLARASIEGHMKKEKAAAPELSPDPELNQPAAVFVTLTKKGALRGCIGTMTPRRLLSAAVAEMAPASAFGDTRFPPLSASELREVRIEISVLSPMRRAAGWEAVEPGRHGVYVRKGRASGTYLPQVWEHFSTREEFLTSLCLEKAGLPADAWREDSTEIYVYTVDNFEEKNLKPQPGGGR